MNYYDHHIRDYDAATSHLSWDEDMAYTRMLRWYYRKERPLPADIAETCRQVRATTKAQRDAVNAVLKEFFVLGDGGWHKDDCDAAIARYQSGEPERDAKKKNEETRLARHRSERAELFGIINAAGQHLPYNAPIAQVRELADRVRDAKPATPATPDGRVSGTENGEAATPPATPATFHATATATPATDLQRLPNTQSPFTTTQYLNTPHTLHGGCEGPTGPATPPIDTSDDDDAYPPDFLRFWEACPRKVGKGAALKAWRKLRPSDAKAERITAAMEAQRANPDWHREDGRFAPYPSTWLNESRFDDAVVKPSERYIGSMWGRSGNGVAL